MSMGGGFLGGGGGGGSYPTYPSLSEMQRQMGQQKRMQDFFERATNQPPPKEPEQDKPNLILLLEDL
jgi:hypothetical protein